MKNVDVFVIRSVCLRIFLLDFGEGGGVESGEGLSYSQKFYFSLCITPILCSRCDKSGMMKWDKFPSLDKTLD